MSRKSRLKRLLAPLLERNGDITIANDWLVVKPVHHVFRGLILDKTSMKGIFYGRWGTTHMFVVRRTCGLEGFINVSGKKYGADFFDLPETVMSTILCEEIESTTLPFLRAMNTLDKYYDHAMAGERPISLWPEAHFCLELGVGHFDIARALYSEHSEYWLQDRPWWKPEHRASNASIRRLGELLAKERCGDIAALFHQWETITAANFKLAGIWEPTPFPFE